MKDVFKKLAALYSSGLRRFLDAGSTENLHYARRLGGRMLKAGLEPLDLARIHELSITEIEESGRKARPAKLLDRFMCEALRELLDTPTDGSKSGTQASQRLAKQARVQSARLNAINGRLKRALAQCRKSERALKLEGQEKTRLMKATAAEPNLVKKLAQRVLIEQEHENLCISKLLHDEVAQSLLGIQVHLLHLKSRSNVSKTNFSAEILIARRLVRASIRSIAETLDRLNSRKPATSEIPAKQPARKKEQEPGVRKVKSRTRHDKK